MYVTGPSYVQAVPMAGVMPAMVTPGYLATPVVVGPMQPFATQPQQVLSTAAAFVEVLPQLQPSFQEDSSGCFLMQVPNFAVSISTQCSAQLDARSKPTEQFVVDFPNLHQVKFDPMHKTPPNATAKGFAQKRGVVLEVPAGVSLDARLKCNSRVGQCVIDDVVQIGGFRQMVDEHRLEWKLIVRGELKLIPGRTQGSQGLEVDLAFEFWAQLHRDGCRGGVVWGHHGGFMTLPIEPVIVPFTLGGPMVVSSPRGRCMTDVLMMQNPPAMVSSPRDRFATADHLTVQPPMMPIGGSPRGRAMTEQVVLNYGPGHPAYPAF